MGLMRTLQMRTLLVAHLVALLVSLYWGWSWSATTVLAGEAGLLLLICLPACRKQPANPLDPHFAGVPIPHFRSDMLKVENIAGIQFGGCTADGGGNQSSLSSSWCCIPHPAKAHRGGEDAVFVTPWSVGCADGVGGWAARGIDSGLYARGLMRSLLGQDMAEAAAEAAQDLGVDLEAMLEAELSDVEVVHKEFGAACYIGDSLPVVLYLTYKCTPSSTACFSAAASAQWTVIVADRRRGGGARLGRLP